jgi:DNA-binding transcriptional regulator YiaG
MADPGPAGAEIFRRCRNALALSESAMAAALHVSGGRTVRKWEAGDRAVPGPAWVALRFMLRAARRRDLAAAVDEVLRWRDAA